MKEMQEERVTSTKSVDIDNDRAFEDKSGTAEASEELAAVISNLEETVSRLRGELDARTASDSEQQAELERLKQQKEKSETAMGDKMEKLNQRIKELEEESSKKEECEQRLRTESQAEVSELKQTYETIINDLKKAASEETSQLQEKNQKLVETLDLQKAKTEDVRNAMLKSKEESESVQNGKIQCLKRYFVMYASKT